MTSHGVTFKEACELISAFLKEKYDIDADPERDIFEYSPAGELSLILDLYDIAKAYYEESANDASI